MNKIDEYKLERIIELIRLSKKPGFITNYIKDCNMLEDQRLSMHPDSENLFKLREIMRDIGLRERDGFGIEPTRDKKTLIVVRAHYDNHGFIGETQQGYLSLGKDKRYHFDGQDPAVKEAINEFYKQ
ncbi:MAG: hypothetical protein ABIC91_08665 [Nanoarchaeota archaeon]|nr:hypothetical protein [Nanoarchaeota archaeon]MBU1030292.1 hypothetical protein [Nanoarchaeota archaeon]MBU1849305.1 hypothetical protein [Nanoarchaeota archaeon]